MDDWTESIEVRYQQRGREEEGVSFARMGECRVVVCGNFSPAKAVDLALKRRQEKLDMMRGE